MPISQMPLTGRSQMCELVILVAMVPGPIQPSVIAQEIGAPWIRILYPQPQDGPYCVNYVSAIRVAYLGRIADAADIMIMITSHKI